MEQPAAAGRKRRRTAVPENPTGAAKGGMEANIEAPKKRDKHLHPLEAIPLSYQWGEARQQDARPLPYQRGAAATQEAIPLPYQWGQRGKTHVRPTNGGICFELARPASIKLEGTIVGRALCALTAYIWACSTGGAQMPMPMYAESSDGNSATSFQGFRRSR